MFAALLHRSIFCLLLQGCVVCAATAPAGERLRGGKVDWARLQTSSRYWDRHANADPAFLKFLRRATSLDIDVVWNSVRPTQAAELGRYPFIFADSIETLSAKEGSALAEYLRRGGFLFIDACRNNDINPNLVLFLRAQLKVLSAQFSDLHTDELLPSHEVFSIYFKMADFPPYAPNDKQHPLRAVFAGGRMIAIIGLNGFQCAWAGYTNEQHATACAQMVTNIYVYAMTR